MDLGLNLNYHQVGHAVTGLYQLLNVNPLSGNALPLTSKIIWHKTDNALPLTGKIIWH
jgi:hypothetical protein